MSVTTPIFRFEVAGADAGADAGAEASDEAGADAGAEAAGVEADGLGVVPPEQAATRMASPPNRLRPERLCMCPPPGSRAVRPRAPWSVTVSMNVRSAERPSAHRSDGGPAGQDPAPGPDAGPDPPPS